VPSRWQCRQYADEPLAYVYSYADTDANSHSDTNAHADTNADADANADTDSYTNANAHADAWPDFLRDSE